MGLASGNHAAVIGLEEPRMLARRARRVTILVIGIIVLSLADLAITLTHLTSTGMMEANPIAAWLIETTRSPLSLACFKMLSVLICIAVLYRLRTRREGEIAAWVAVLILAGMSVMWHAYTQQVVSGEVHLAQATAQGHWLRLD